MANSQGASSHVRVPAEQPNYDETYSGAVGAWVTMDEKSGPGDGSFDVAPDADWPSTGGWQQT